MTDIDTSTDYSAIEFSDSALDSEPGTEPIAASTSSEVTTDPSDPSDETAQPAPKRRAPRPHVRDVFDEEADAARAAAAAPVEPFIDLPAGHLADAIDGTPVRMPAGRPPFAGAHVETITATAAVRLVPPPPGSGLAPTRRIDPLGWGREHTTQVTLGARSQLIDDRARQLVAGLGAQPLLVSRDDGSPHGGTLLGSTADRVEWVHGALIALEIAGGGLLDRLLAGQGGRTPDARWLSILVSHLGPLGNAHAWRSQLGPTLQPSVVAELERQRQRVAAQRRSPRLYSPTSEAAEGGIAATSAFSWVSDETRVVIRRAFAAALKQRADIPRWHGVPAGALAPADAVTGVASVRGTAAQQERGELWRRIGVTREVLIGLGASPAAADRALGGRSSGSLYVAARSTPDAAGAELSPAIVWERAARYAGLSPHWTGRLRPSLDANDQEPALAFAAAWLNDPSTPTSEPDRPWRHLDFEEFRAYLDPASRQRLGLDATATAA